MKPHCDWCSTTATYRVHWTGTRLPPHERPAVCEACKLRPALVLASIGVTCSLVVIG